MYLTFTFHFILFSKAYSYAKIVPVVCLYAGEVDMLERVQGTLRNTENKMNVFFLFLLFF